MNPDCGIYSITSPSGKQYIGQARSFKQRWAEHRKDLRAGKHHCKGLQNAFNKYGEKAIVFSKIAFVAADQLTRREQEQIDSRPRELLYNTLLLVGAPIKDPFFGPILKASISAKLKGRTRVFSAEHCRRLALSQTGKSHTLETRQRMSAAKQGAKNNAARTIVCVDTGAVFRTAIEAAAWVTQIKGAVAARQHISSTCSGKLKSAYGYRWRYAREEEVSTLSLAA